MNTYQFLQQGWASSRESTSLELEDGRCVSYGQLEAHAGQLHRQLSDLGVVPGDRVVVQIEKSSDAVALYLAVLRAGAIYVPLNVAYTAEEVASFVEDAEPRVLVCEDGRRASLERAARDASILTEHDLAPSTDHVPAPPLAARSSEDLAAIVYTSGTTGRSKGAMLTHGNLTSNARSLHQLWGFRDGDVLLHALPIFHVHGLFVALHTALVNASRVLFFDRFDAGVVLGKLPQATVMMGVPTFYVRLLEEPGFDRESCSNMRLFISGSAPLNEATFEEFERRTGHKILERYGMSEAGMITSNPLDGERVAGTVGFALPDVVVRVADESGELMAPNEVGVLEVKGPNLFSGYWRLPEKTQEEHRSDGFFITGDVATMDEHGRVSIVGRAKDLVICGGYNIYPKEIEGVLDEQPGILESAVIGVPHSDLGEGVVAVLVQDPNEPPVDPESLKPALDERLARFKHPRRFYVVDALPRNTMGKVQKNQLRETYAEAYSD